MTSKRTQMLCLWCGPAAIVVFMIAFWPLAGWMPPPSPADSAREVQAMYADRTDLIRAGLVLMMVAGAMTAPFVAVITTQIKRIEGPNSPLAYTQLGLGMLGVFLFLLPAFLMQAAAFRLDREPESIALIHDAGWLLLVGAFAPATFQTLTIAVAVFRDTDEKVFPRWLGYFNVWAALLFVPAALLFYFKSGPFAWDGVFVFWLPLSVFSAWFIVMFAVVRKAILRQSLDEQPPAVRRAAPDIVAA